VLPGHKGDGWGIFDRELITFTTIRMDGPEALARAEELNGAQEAPQDAPAPVSGLPLPIVTTDELLALLAPLTDAERLAVDLAELDAPTDPAA
jgi:hypothetical protein